MAPVPPYDTTPLDGDPGVVGTLDDPPGAAGRRAKRSSPTCSAAITTWATADRSASISSIWCGPGQRPIACLGWSSAPRQLDLRDQFVGAPKEAYRHHLHRIAYNTRFLIVPWVNVPHLASHLLSRIARRISDDWQALYHHPIDLLESFVDTERFRGTCYRAANWIWVGRSVGRGTKSKTPTPSVSIKELWVYPVDRHFRQKLLRAP